VFIFISFLQECINLFTVVYNFVYCSTKARLVVSCYVFFIGRQKWAYLVEVSVVYIIIQKKVRHTQLASVITSGTLLDCSRRCLQSADN
jgi:hypothetical protein